MGYFGSVLLDKERMKYEKTQTKEAWKAKVRAGTKPEGSERSGHQACNSLKSARWPGQKDCSTMSSLCHPGKCCFRYGNSYFLEDIKIGNFHIKIIGQ